MMRDQATIERFADTLRGRLIQADDPNYDKARKIYNAMIDKRPRLIVQCANVADVIAAVKFGRDHDLDTAIRGGGHSGPGLALVEDGLVIDLSKMRGIRIDLDTKTVRAEAGCHWGDVDHATHAFGLATVSGIISTTGVGGPLFWPLEKLEPTLRWYRDWLPKAPEDVYAFYVAAEVPTSLSSMHLYPIDGAVHRAGQNETAWNYRDATWSMVVTGVDPNPDNKEKISEWARDYWQSLHRHSAGASYVNFMMEEGEERIRASYGDHYERLRKIKAKYDPDNFFHINQNIEPANVMTR